MGKYYVVFFNDRCMGFATDLEGAARLVCVFGEGSDYEEVAGTFPVDEARAAAEHNARRAASAKVVSIVPKHDSEVCTVELSQEELANLAGALGVAADSESEEGLPDDPWASEENTLIIGPAPGESGFFASKAG